jgi:glycosyltransferase involved in cell wall biosynthesis
MTTGKYLYPNKLPVGNEHLAPLDICYDSDLRDRFLKLNPNGYTYGKGKLNLDKEFIDKFDIIFTSWILEPIVEYWPLFKDKLVIYESLGQSDPAREITLNSLRSQGLKVVRMSAGEENFSNYCGADAVIDLDVDSKYYKGWSSRGDKSHNVLTVNSALMSRSSACNAHQYMQVTNDLPRKLYGSHNEDLEHLPFVYGKATRDEILKQYQTNKVYFSLGTKPCPVVLSFKEAMCVGIPTVTWGPKLGGPTFRAHTFIENGINGFYSDNLADLNSYIKLLLNDEKLANSISSQARKTGILNFSRDVISVQWLEFFINNGMNPFFEEGG